MAEITVPCPRPEADEIECSGEWRFVAFGGTFDLVGRSCTHPEDGVQFWLAVLAAYEAQARGLVAAGR